MVLQLPGPPILFLNPACSAGEISEAYGHATKSLVMPTAGDVSLITPNNVVVFFINVYVVVQFGFWFNLDFTLFFSMLIYDNEYQTKENPN